MEEINSEKTKRKRLLLLLLKIVVTVACLWYVSGKIDFERAGQALSKSNWLFIGLALLLFIISKWIAAKRLYIYFNNIELHLTSMSNLKLYWLGMFYNLFLPGSIGGDAYKVIVLNRKYKTPIKKLTVAVLLDRFSGVIAIGMLLAAYSFFTLKVQWQILMIVSGSVLSVMLLWILLRSWWKEFLADFIPTLLLGLLVQGLQIGAVYLIMLALHIPIDLHGYVFIFLVSSMASVLPLTIGPLGIREFVFLEGSTFFGLSQDNAVLISILFFLITLVTSAFGLFYIYRDPLAQKNKDSI